MERLDAACGGWDFVSTDDEASPSRSQGARRGVYANGPELEAASGLNYKWLERLTWILSTYLLWTAEKIKPKIVALG